MTGQTTGQTTGQITDQTAANGGLATRVLGQTGLLFGGFALAQGLSFVRNAALGHWLSKGDFGIAAAITLMLQTIETLSDLGADRLIVQAADGTDRRLIGNLHTTLLVRGIVTALLLMLAAGPVAGFFHVPHAASAFAAIALVPLAKGLSNLDYKRRQRELDNRAYVAMEVMPQLAAALALLPTLYLEPSYRAAVWLGLAQALVMVAVSHGLARRRYEIAFDRATIGRILAFGWPIWLSAFPLVAVYHGDRALVGRMLGMDVLAGYSAAFMLTMVPGLVAAKVGNAVMLPLLAGLRGDSVRFAARHRLMLELTTLVAALYAATFIICGETLLPAVFGNNYQGLGPVCGWLAAMWAVRMVQAVPGMALLAHGITQPFLGAGLVRATGLAGAFCAAVAGAGLEGVAVAGLAAEIGSLLYMSRQAERAAAGTGKDCVRTACLLMPAAVLSTASTGLMPSLLGNVAILLAWSGAVLPLGVLALPELRSLACSAWRVHAPEHRANTA